MKNIWLAATIVAALAITPACKASGINFSYSATSQYSNPVTATGTLTATYQGDGAYLVTGLSGTFTDGSTSGTLALDPNSGVGDDLIYSGPGITDALDVLGLVLDFTPTQGFGPGIVSIYSAGTDVFYWTDALGGNTVDYSNSGTFAVSGVPEPKTWMLLATNLLAVVGLACLMRRKQTAEL